MKAVFSLIFIFGFLIAVCLGISPEARRLAEKEILDSCKGIVGAHDDDVNQILDRKIPASHNGKCLLKCAYEKVGIIVNGWLSVDNMRILGARELDGDDKALEILNEMIDECEQNMIEEEDLCEQSSKMMDCMTQAKIKRGMDPKKGIEEFLGSS